MGDLLKRPLTKLAGVGPRRAHQLEAAGIGCLEDLLLYRPFRYEDRTDFRPISGLQEGKESVCQVEVLVKGIRTTPRRRVRIFEMRVGDASGSIAVKFFNQPYLDRTFRKGQKLIVFGTPRRDEYATGLALINPEYEMVRESEERAIHTGRIVPVYRRLGVLSTRFLRQLIFQALQELPEDLDDPLPERVLQRCGFPSRKAAFERLHFPYPDESPRRRFLTDLASGQTPAQLRFAFEELFLFQLGLQLLREQRRRHSKRHRIRVTARTRELVKSILPFHPTAAQKRALKEIVDDLTDGNVMSRLLQGDVGSGKTIVALQAMLVVVASGYQAALMVPTEILARQHFQKIARYLDSTPYSVELLSGASGRRERGQILEALREGSVSILVGTHALLQQDVKFKHLALAVIDEQHRFGVLQRSLIMGKGACPDTLVMTATPIPRSLAMTVYGDLDLSLIDEMPPGRLPVRTIIKRDDNRRQVYELIRRELAKGRQGYIVYPLIEESEKVDLKSAVEMAGHLQKSVFPGLEVGLLHGRMKADQKERLMERFRRGEIQILVSTTVIEVGIDVPAATLMVVENAERFGLSQLHQLRGRVGRGSHPGLCILMTPGVCSQEGYQRLEVMRKTVNGFEIAEKDLELRGPGDFLGTRQSGLPRFRFADLIRHRKLLELARREARYSIERSYDKEGYDKEGEPQRDRRQAILEEWKKKFGLWQVG